MFLTSLKQTCNEYLIKFSENQSALKLENRKTSPCSPCALNLLHVLVSRIPGYHNLCSPGKHATAIIGTESNLNKHHILRSEKSILSSNMIFRGKGWALWADMEFVKSFTSVRFPTFSISPKKTRKSRHFFA